MMNERRRKRHILKVDHYDGQSIYSGRKLFYELGGYLGGGAAGVVYEAFCARTHRHVAIKILNPVGYKLLPSTLLTRCIVAVRGKPLEPTNAYHDDHHEFHDEFSPFGRSHGTYGTQNGNGNVTPGGSNRFSSVATRMSLENVWWLIHPSTKQAVAAYEDPRTGMLRELSLPQCIDVWGAELRVDDCQDDLDSTFEQLEEAYQEVQVKGQTLKIPKIPKKFIKFALTRRTIHREIANMSGLGFHENVLRLEEALELVQDSKCTTFLVLELAAGGELFDRIKLDCGTDEDTARRYFQQLISGVAFCHSSGVCHRDLKPENLLLADTEEFSTLKIADFGLSAIFAMTEQGGAGAENSMGPDGSSSSAVQAIRRLRSVVGSPHYVAPEVLMDAGQGYDGAKADAWSIGVIVYAMLAGNLPFGKDLLKCLRYEKFKKWCYNTKYSDEDPVDEVAFPTWFFPAQFTLEVKSLITQLLYPDPSMRISVEEAQRHAWVLGQRLTRRANAINEENPETSPSFPSTISPPGNIVSPVLFREAPTAVSPNVIQRSTAASPGGYNRMHQGYNGRSTVNTPSGIGVSPSPQTAALRGHLINSGYMPSLDETSPLSSGNTPVQSPRCNHQDEEERNSGTTLQFDMDQPTQESTKRQSATSSETVKVEEEAELYSRECQPQPSLVRAPSSVSSLPPIAPSSASSLITDTQRASRRRFTSPPLATGSRCSLLERHHYQHRRNSPPELFLSRFGKGFKFEAIQTAFEDIDLEQFQASAINLASTPTESTLRQQSGRRPRFLSLSSSQSVPNTPMGASQSSPGENSQESSPVSSTPGTSDPPSYQTDLVARSTRFITALPAQLVLTKIETILMTNPTPRPSGSNRQGESPQQLVTIDWENYQMEVSYGDVLTCTVQVFLFQRGVYLVEFRRGQVEIFQFKRFYEDIREKLSDNMEMSVASPRSIQNVRNSDEDTLSGPSSQRQPRKRNNSLSAQEGLLK